MARYPPRRLEATLRNGHPRADQALADHEEDGDQDQGEIAETGYRLLRRQDIAQGKGGNDEQRDDVHADAIAGEQEDGEGKEPENEQGIGCHSNFPGAQSSSANMLSAGWTRRRIFSMWFALMVTTAVGAGLGFLLASVLSEN